MKSKDTSTTKSSKRQKDLKPSKATSSPRITKKQPKTKSVPAKGLEDEDDSDLELENEVDEENALAELEQQQSHLQGVNEEEEEDELLEGFESDSSSDSEEGAALNLPPVPRRTNREKKVARKAAKAAKAAVPVPSIPGTIYLGHIPHGFFEKQMHSYFSQFGTITRLRLSRNRRTGKSKHYGWVEFQSKDVAQIVAETMDGYLIHPHRMVCKVVEVDDNVWKGSNKVFKKIPWVKINREKLEGKRTKEKWEDLARKDHERMEKRMEKIKELGIDYDFPAKGEKRKAEAPVQEVKSKKGKVEKASQEKRVPSATTKEKTKSKAHWK